MYIQCIYMCIAHYVVKAMGIYKYMYASILLVYTCTCEKGSLVWMGDTCTKKERHIQSASCIFVRVRVVVMLNTCIYYTCACLYTYSMFTSL